MLLEELDRTLEWRTEELPEVTVDLTLEELLDEIVE